MWTTIKSSTQIARKNYPCNACEQLIDSGLVSFEDGSIRDNNGFADKVTFDERRAIITAAKNGWRIMKGQRYNYQFNTDGGDTCQWRTIPEIDAIMLKYKLYRED